MLSYSSKIIKQQIFREKSQNKTIIRSALAVFCWLTLAAEEKVSLQNGGVGKKQVQSTLKQVKFRRNVE